MKIKEQILLAEMNHALAQMHLAAAAAHNAPEDCGLVHLQEGYGWGGEFDNKKAELEALLAESNLEGRNE